MMKGGRNNGGRGHRPEPQPWKDQIQMRFGDRLVNVRSPALTRDPSEARRFVREHTDLASSDSFSRIITFDTECSVNYADYCEMCSFGYAEYDLEGNEIAREEIYIRAREPKGRLREKCQADYSKFKDAPKWELQYHKIREIMTRKDTLYIAHSCRSDIGFIMMMNRRRGTDQFYCRVYDTLDMFKTAMPGMEKYNLPFLAESLGIEHDAHVSLSDAIVCFKVLCKVAERNGKTLKEMFSEHEDCMSDSVDVLRDFIRSDRRRLLAVIKESDYNPIRGPLTGLRFCMDERTEKSDPEAVLEFARYVVSNGGSYVSGVSSSNVFVWDGNKENRSYVYAMRLVKDGADLEIVSVDEAMDGRYGDIPEICWDLQRTEVR